MRARVCLSILLVCILSSIIYAAHLEPMHLMTDGRCWSRAFNATESDPVDDPNTGWQEEYYVSKTDTAQDLFLSSAVSTAQVSAGLKFINDSTPEQVHLTAIVNINGQTTAAESGFNTYIDFSTERNGYGTHGLFYQVVGDGEPAGTPMTIDLSWLVQASNTASRGWLEFDYLWGAGGLMVAINSDPSHASPSLDSVIYYRPPLFFPSGSATSDSDHATFVAKVGDTVAIYWGAQAGWTNNSNTHTSGVISGQMDVTLQVVNGRSNLADINTDKMINLTDLALLAENWLGEAIPAGINPADINKDEFINLPDQALLARNWQWEAAPVSNQTCDNAVLVRPGIVYEENMADSTTGQLWYRIRPFDPGRYIVSLCGSDFDTRLTQYRQLTVCPGDYVAQNDNYWGLQSQLTADVREHSNTYFLIDSPTGQAGTMRLELTRLPRPENDEPGMATWAQTYVTYSGSTIGSVEDMSVWFTFTPESDDTYIISLCGSSFDTILQVKDLYTGQVLWSNDNACGLASEITAYLTAGTMYVIQVDGYERGDYQFRITQESPPPPVPLNDECMQAETIYALQPPASGTTTGATGSDISSCMDGDNQDVWYRFMADSMQVYWFSLSTYGAEKTLSLYFGPECPGFEYSCEQTNGGWVEYPMFLMAGEEVLIRVGSSAAEAGDFSLYVY